jgi:predicted  nucleic acid-binding Zn-ribbon protein
MSHQAALEALGKMTRVFKAFEDAEVVLKTLAGVEQNEKELRAAADVARADADKARAELADIKDDVASAKKAVAKAKEDATAKAAQIIADAQEKAAAIEQRSAVAQTKAARDLADAGGRLDTTLASLSKAVSELDDIEAKIEKARNQIAKMLG